MKFLDFSQYAGGIQNIPEGMYALEFQFVNFQPTKKDNTPSGAPFLAVELTAHDLNDAAHCGENAYKAPLGMGTAMTKTFIPNPDDPKTLLPIAGGPGACTPNDSTNWAVFLQSLINCGLPPEFSEEETLAGLDGMHCHLTNVPEPANRQGFQSNSATSEVPQEKRQNKVIPAVQEILPDGRPWEGTGGIPDVEAVAPAKAKAPVKAPVKVAGKPTVTAATKPNGKVALRVVAKAAAPAAAPVSDDLFDLVQGAMATYLEKNPNGCPRLGLRSAVGASLTASHDKDTAKSATDTYFADDEALASVLGPLGFQDNGGKIQPVAQ